MGLPRQRRRRAKAGRARGGWCIPEPVTAWRTSSCRPYGDRPTDRRQATGQSTEPASMWVGVSFALRSLPSSLRQSRPRPPHEVAAHARAAAALLERGNFKRYLASAARQAVGPTPVGKVAPPWCMWATCNVVHMCREGPACPAGRYRRPAGATPSALPTIRIYSRKDMHG